MVSLKVLILMSKTTSIWALKKDKATHKAILETSLITLTALKTVAIPLQAVLTQLERK